MNLPAHASYVMLCADAFMALCVLIWLSAMVVTARTRNYGLGKRLLIVCLGTLLVGTIMAAFASRDTAVETSTFPVEHYVTKHQERSALASLYHVTYAGHDHSGDIYRRSNGSMLYGCATHYTKHTTSVRLDALTCGQTVVR